MGDTAPPSQKAAVQRGPASRCGGQVVNAFKNNYFAEMRSGSEEGSYLRLVELCITQL